MHGAFTASKGSMPSPLGRESEFVNVKQVRLPQKQNHRQWIALAGLLPPNWNQLTENGFVVHSEKETFNSSKFCC